MEHFKRSEQKREDQVSSLTARTYDEVNKENKSKFLLEEPVGALSDTSRARGDTQKRSDNKPQIHIKEKERSNCGELKLIFVLLLSNYCFLPIM